MLDNTEGMTRSRRPCLLVLLYLVALLGAGKEAAASAASRRLQQAAAGAACQSHNVVPIKRGATSNSLDLLERKKRASQGGDLFDVQAVLAELTCPDALQAFNRLENELPTYGQGILAEYNASTPDLCFDYPTCTGVIKTKAVDWQAPQGSDMSSSWAVLEVQDAPVSQFSIPIPAADTLTPLIPGLTPNTAVQYQKLGNPVVRVKPAGAAQANDPGCYMYVEYPPSAVADARTAIGTLNASLKLPPFGSLATPPGRRLLQVDGQATANCVGSTVALAGATVAGGAACVVTFGGACAGAVLVGVGAGIMAGANCQAAVEKNNAGCFPAAATVEMQGGARKRMDALQLGDKIRSVDPLTGAARFEEVYLFGHQDSATSADYVHLDIQCPGAPGGVPGDNLTLKLTPGHFLPVAPEGRGKWGEHRLVPAMRARAGARVWAAAPGGVALCHVAAAVMSPSTGLFNPYTRNGLLVVDGVVTSAHSDWFLERFVPAKYEHLIPAAYQAILAPVRGLYGMMGPARARHVQEEWGLVELFARGNVEPFKGWVTSV
ncbi:hypothetical protein KFL_006010050 [Klebsormidium nitens]|uniref:Hint domain-containing protein n=1 Tax=Klebsormidium nitens TaxID=105231 RepID=A0A1Y1IL00_KLENI|nr:hypothetical protein KFL_006010050 [Klebsormidium nitens]|eukprot:GAQ90109.1 hypothetical protein KFL_006010050 [Klebsormidium nitens]